MLNKRDKRGQGLQISTIILIILGVAILVALIYGFVVGWDKLLPWLSTGNNVDAVIAQCQVACSTNSVYSYCTQTRTLQATDLPGNVKQVINTCNYFANTLKNAAGQSYGIATCPSVVCPAP